MKKLNLDGVLHTFEADAENVHYGSSNVKATLDALVEGSGDIDVSQRGYFGMHYPDQMRKIVELDKKQGCLRFIHVTDTHDDSGGAAHFNSLGEGGLLRNSAADFFVHTGDIVKNNFWDTIGWNALLAAETKPCFVVLGNHDCTGSTKTSSSGSINDRSVAQALQARYDKYFLYNNEPFIDADEVEDGKTYYHKDFINGYQKYRCLFLDPTDAGCTNWNGTGSQDGESYWSQCPNMSNTQKVWFIQQLQDAAKNGYHVLIFVHVKPGYIDDPNIINTTVSGGGDNPNYIAPSERDGANKASGFFSTLIGDSYDILGNGVGEWLLEVVDEYMTGGSITFNNTDYHFCYKGAFVGWFCGHTHWDCYGWCRDYPKQFFAVSNKLWPNYTYDDSDMTQNPRDHFKYIVVNGEEHKVTLFNVGNQLLKNGDKRMIFTYNYD